MGELLRVCCHRTVLYPYCIHTVSKNKKNKTLQLGYTSRNIKIEPGATLIGCLQMTLMVLMHST